MINKTLQITMLIAIAVYFVFLLTLLKKKRLNLKYTLLWILSGLLMLLFAIFPQFLTVLTVLVGIDVPTNALFAMLFFCVDIILMSLTAIVSKLNDRVKTLAQCVALLEKQTREQGESKE